MTVVRIATEEDATEVGRVLADGFGNDPVMSWVLGEQDRDHKLETFFGSWLERHSCPSGQPTSNPEAAPPERHGFRTTGEIELPDGPTLTTMMRR